MQYTYQPRDPGRKYRGIVIVVVIHVLLAWAVVSGTAKKGLEIIKKPLEAVVIQEVFIPPPPPPHPLTYINSYALTFYFFFFIFCGGFSFGLCGGLVT